MMIPIACWQWRGLQITPSRVASGYKDNVVTQSLVGHLNNVKSLLLSSSVSNNAAITTSCQRLGDTINSSMLQKIQTSTLVSNRRQSLLSSCLHLSSSISDVDRVTKLGALAKQQSIPQRSFVFSIDNNRNINFIPSVDLSSSTYISPRTQPKLLTKIVNFYTQKRSLSINRSLDNSSGITMAQVVSGKEVSDEIRAKLKARVEKLAIKPKLAIVQVGGREDSNVYIRMKVQFAESIGASAVHIKLDKNITEDELAKKVQELNHDSGVHGIITQLPFDTTSEIDSDKIVNMIDPGKDVDGLCVYNAGKLSHGELNKSSFIPCTPNGCMELIKKTGVKISGAHAVVIGRSKIVGSPMAQLLLWHDATVTICHSRTKNLEDLCRQADILVAAVGRAQMVKKSWLKPGAVVIDCGINVIPDATKKSGTRLVGDVAYDECKEIASAITPVPGGVGPMTVAMLIANTVESCERSQK